MLREDRSLDEKATEIKAQGYFLRSAPKFAETEIVGDTVDGKIQVNNRQILVRELRSRDQTGFYIARHNDSTSTSTTSFALQIDTHLGPALINSTLNGREAKVFVSNYHLPFRGKSNEKFFIRYTSAALFWAGRVEDREIYILHGKLGQIYDIEMFWPEGAPQVVQHECHQAEMITSLQLSTFTLNILPLCSGVTSIGTSQRLLLFFDTELLPFLWAPQLLIPGPLRPLSSDNSIVVYWAASSAYCRNR